MALKETPDLEGTGFVLGTASSGYDPTIVREIELHVERTVWAEVEDRTELRDLPLPIESHHVHDENHGELQLSIYQPDPAKKAWTGKVVTPQEELTFVLEEQGSPFPLVLIPIFVWAVGCGVAIIKDAIKDCEDKAIEVCGVGKVRRVKSKRSWTKGGCGLSCDIRCVDGHAVTHDVDVLSTAPAAAG